MARTIGPRPQPNYYPKQFPNTHVQGFEDVMNNLNAEIMKIKDASMKGLIEAAILIRKDTEKSTPKTPVDLGNLRSSWFVVTAKGKEKDDEYNKGFRNVTSEKRRKTKLEGNAAQFLADRQSAITEMTMKAKSFLPAGQQTLIMGYSANYAVYVHENMAYGINWKRTSSGPKWFQGSVFRNSSKILGIIKKNVEIR
jgi:hypothetical protein